MSLTGTLLLPSNLTNSQSLVTNYAFNQFLFAFHRIYLSTRRGWQPWERNAELGPTDAYDIVTEGNLTGFDQQAPIVCGLLRPSLSLLEVPTTQFCDPLFVALDFLHLRPSPQPTLSPRPVIPHIDGRPRWPLERHPSHRRNRRNLCPRSAPEPGGGSRSPERTGSHHHFTKAPF